MAKTSSLRKRIDAEARAREEAEAPARRERERERELFLAEQRVVDTPDPDGLTRRQYIDEVIRRYAGMATAIRKFGAPPESLDIETHGAAEQQALDAFRAVARDDPKAARKLIGELVTPWGREPLDNGFHLDLLSKLVPAALRAKRVEQPADTGAEGDLRDSADHREKTAVGPNEEWVSVSQILNRIEPVPGSPVPHRRTVERWADKDEVPIDRTDGVNRRPWLHIAHLLRKRGQRIREGV